MPSIESIAQFSHKFANLDVVTKLSDDLDLGILGRC